MSRNNPDESWTIAGDGEQADEGTWSMRGWSDRTLRRAAWGVTWSMVIVLVGCFAVTYDAPTTASETSWGSSGVLAQLLFQLLTLTFPLVGLLILRRQPRNRIGWILLAGIGVATTLSTLIDSYLVFALVVSPGHYPLVGLAAGLNEASWVWWIGLMGIYVILLFPDGRLPSPRWRWLPWLAGVVIAVVTLVITIAPGPLDEGPIPGMQNPIGADSLRRPLLVALVALLPVFPGCIIAAAVALVLRFRRSRGLEREQLKWLALAGALVAICYLVAMVGPAFQARPFEGADPPWVKLAQDVALLSFGLIPLAIGAAILRHRLYDIDRLLNRTAVYAVLTAALVTTYLGSVLLLRVALDPVTGDSDLAVAGSTLAVAALFRPLRARIQGAVDRRFYRSRYDAARTIEAFSGRLRQEVDLRAVSSDLRRVVDDTMQPGHVTVWLRSR